MSVSIQAVQGLLSEYSIDSTVVHAIKHSGILQKYNQVPLITHVPESPVGSPIYTINYEMPRPDSYTLAAAVTSATQTTLTFTNVGTLMQGDILALPGGTETVQVNGDPNTTANTVSVLRAYSGTAVASVANGSVVNLIGNARNGGEINITGVSNLPFSYTQYTQTIQYPIRITGQALATGNYVGIEGATNALQTQMMLKLGDMLNDQERAAYYGPGVAPTSPTARPSMFGIYSILANNAPQNINASAYTGGAIPTAPVNAGAFSPIDFAANLLQPALNNLGMVDTVICSPDWQTYFNQMQTPLQRFDVDDEELGGRVTVFRAPFQGDVTIIIAPHLRAGSAIGISRDEIQWDFLRQFQVLPYGIQGDAAMADLVMECSINLRNPLHFTFVSGVTAGAPA